MNSLATPTTSKIRSKRNFPAPICAIIPASTNESVRKVERLNSTPSLRLTRLAVQTVLSSQRTSPKRNKNPEQPSNTRTHLPFSASRSLKTEIGPQHPAFLQKPSMNPSAASPSSRLMRPRNSFGHSLPSLVAFQWC